jgi:hypothetical protein
MATTTPNYGWDVPTSTDYVKDGATAIETLGDDIDASLFSITGGKNVGAVFINSTAFSGATTVTVDNVFTSSFQNYLIVCNLTSASTFNVVMQMRIGGTPTGGSAYSYGDAFIGYTTGTLTASGASGTASWPNVGRVNSDNASFAVTLYQPQTATKTFHNTFTTDSILYRTGGGMCNVNTQFDGFQISGTAMTGTVRVYGLRNS